MDISCVIQDIVQPCFQWLQCGICKLIATCRLESDKTTQTSGCVSPLILCTRKPMHIISRNHVVCALFVVLKGKKLIQILSVSGNDMQALNSRDSTYTYSYTQLE